MRRDFASSSGSSRASVETLTVDLGGFPFEALGGSESDERAMAARLRRAVETYWADRTKDRPGWVYPAAVQEHVPGDAVTVSLELPSALADDLAQEAHRRAVSVSQLVNHAALYYLAELDTGRLTQRILDDLPESK